MGKIHSRIRQETERALISEAQTESETLKGCTIRLTPEYIQLIDLLADYLNETRQTFLSALIYDAVDEALAAYASVFKDPTDVIKATRKQCGFPFGYFEFCQDEGLDPDDPDTAKEYQEFQLSQFEARMDSVDWSKPVEGGDK
jgi:3-hydroxyacyl-CoA dehydrogenase